MGGLARRGGSMQDRFGRELLDRFRASPAIAESWYSAERFAIGYRRTLDGPVCWAYLGTLYAACAGLAGERRDLRLDRYVTAMIDPATVPRGWEAAAPLLRPVLCGASFGRSVPGQPVPPEMHLLRRPALPFLDELVVVDLPTTRGYVTADLAACWGVPQERIFAAARRNLAGDRRSGADVPATTGEPKMLRFVDDGDAYWVSRLLLDGWLAGLGELVGGRPVAFAPDRDSLLVVRDGVQLGGIFDIVAAECREAARPVSPMAYTVDDRGAVVPFQAGPGHPLRHAVARAQRSLAGGEYDAQAESLRERWEPAVAGHVAVASYLLAEHGAAPPVSVATWVEDVATLLPVTDQVALVGRDRRESWLIDWDVLVGTLGLRAVPALRPTRYRVGRWPRGEQRRQLLLHATHRRDAGTDG
jgi:hypothetical protein